jgi:hypothetical protein
MNDQQSPFLKLPAEIRLMVYDKLCKHHYMPAVDRLSHVLIKHSSRYKTSRSPSLVRLPFERTPPDTPLSVCMATRHQACLQNIHMLDSRHLPPYPQRSPAPALAPAHALSRRARLQLPRKSPLPRTHPSQIAKLSRHLGRQHQLVQGGLRIQPRRIFDRDFHRQSLVLHFQTPRHATARGRRLHQQFQTHTWY